MRQYVLIVLAVCALHAHAETKKKEKLDLTPPGQTTETTTDPGSATQLLYADPKITENTKFEPQGKGSKVKVVATCTDSMGMLHNKGDPGYEGCMRSRDRTQPDVNRDPRRGPTVGITIGR
jgi:hypothetical protein